MNYLVHHGIKGQKWGVRRYQNKDGIRTAAGKKRYSGLTKDKNTKEAHIKIQKKAIVSAVDTAVAVAFIDHFFLHSPVKNVMKYSAIAAGIDYVGTVLLEEHRYKKHGEVK